jgi:L-iditol 2-dehydrogenase
MLAAVMSSPGHLELVEKEDPEVPKDGALVKVEACGICGTDVKMMTQGHRDLVYPRILGHEIAGRVVESDGDSWPGHGSRISIWPGMACGHCRHCTCGRDNRCKEMRILGFNRDGGMAELLALPSESLRGCCLVPDGVAPVHAALAEPLGCCVNAQDMAKVGDDDVVLVLGGGPLGCLNAMLAGIRGASLVIITEVLEGRLKILQRDLRRSVQKGCGIRIVNAKNELLSEVVIEETIGCGVDVIIPATPEVNVDGKLISMLRSGGRISVFCGPQAGCGAPSIDISAVHYHELTVAGSYGCSSVDFRNALSLISSGAIDPSMLITMRMPLQRADEAFCHSVRREGMRSTILL